MTKTVIVTYRVIEVLKVEDDHDITKLAEFLNDPETEIDISEKSVMFIQEYDSDKILFEEATRQEEPMTKTEALQTSYVEHCTRLRSAGVQP